MKQRLLPAVILVMLLPYIIQCSDNQRQERTQPLDTSWHPDILPGYEARYVEQGMAFDGPCRSTIIRKRAEDSSLKGVLYVHGFNDYFFQKEMGELYVDSGYHFYAVDLRRYGRSLEAWQYPFNVRKIDEYFADIDSALNQMRRDGCTDITLSGHSTGGLITALYVAVADKDGRIVRLVTDSPFLEWNFSKFYRNVLIPAVSFVAPAVPDAKIKQGHCDGYAYSLLKKYHGEWVYNTDWKTIYSPPVTFSWVRSIERAQEMLMDQASEISVPVLVMHSDRMVSGCTWTPAFQHGDAVLNPEQIALRGRRLGKKVKVVTIDGGLHDLILSEKRVREAAYDTIFSFIRTSLN